MLEDKLKKGYEEYIKYPLAALNWNSELYDKGWVILEGLACISPHPHRHYTFVEFVYYCGKKEELIEKFVK